MGILVMSLHNHLQPHNNHTTMHSLSLLNIVSLALSKRFTSVIVISVILIPRVAGDTALIDKVGTSVVAREHIVEEIQLICDTENNP